MEYLKKQALPVRLGALVTHIESIVYNHGKLNEIESLIPQIRSSFTFMQNTINEFYTLYAKPSQKGTFSLSKVINDVWGMLSAKALNSNIKLIIKDDHNAYLESYEHSFAHVMLVLIDNAINVAKERAIETPYVFVTITPFSDSIHILVEDNCGGIKQNPIESIFDIYVTDKENQLEHNGIGLSIVKTLICEKLGGNISVKNCINGAQFFIKIPILS